MSAVITKSRVESMSVPASMWSDFSECARSKELEFCYSVERGVYVVWSEHTDALEDIRWAIQLLRGLELTLR